jgi:hypothetical protein
MQNRQTVWHFIFLCVLDKQTKTKAQKGCRKKKKKKGALGIMGKAAKKYMQQKKTWVAK